MISSDAKELVWVDENDACQYRVESCQCRTGACSCQRIEPLFFADYISTTFEPSPHSIKPRVGYRIRGEVAKYCLIRMQWIEILSQHLIGELCNVILEYYPRFILDNC